MSVICFDLDGVICNQTAGDYENAKPDKDAIKLINKLYDEKHTIVIYTARYMGRNKNDLIKTYKMGYDFTIKQLNAWGVKYHEIHMGKPRYDIIIDDRSIFYKKDFKEIYNKIKTRK